MATEASRIHAEITNAPTETLQFLQRYPENSLSFLIPVLPAFRITRRAIANFGKELPKKDIEWCQKWQTIEPPEESKSSENYSTADATTQDNASAIRDTYITEDFSTTDATTQEASSTTDATTQNDASATQDTHKNACSLIDDEVVTKFKGKDKEFKSWTHHPDLFWKSPTTQERPEAILDERSFFKNTAEQQAEVEALNLIRRFDSVIAYLRYKKKMPLRQLIRLCDVEIFLGKMGIPIEQAPKQQTVLSSGRRRLQFCHLLSKNNADFSKACHDDINFDDVDYGVLFLGIDDKIWDSPSSKNYNLMKKTVKDLKRWDIIAISEKSKAKFAAKALLQSRQASIENQTPPPPSDDKENNSTAAPSDVEGNSSIVASEHSRTEADLDGTRASESSPAEDHLDNTRALKRSRAEDHLDGTRASKRSRTEDDSDGTRASERAHTEDNLEILLQAAAFAGQNADASETSIANLVSDLPTEQSNSEIMNTILGQSYSTQNVAFHTQNGFSSEFPFRSEELFPCGVNTPAFGLAFSDGQPNIFDDPDINAAIFSIYYNDGELYTDIQLPEVNAQELLDVPLPERTQAL